MLKPKVALVTGGGTGIGKAIAAQLAKNGVSVAIASRSQSRVETVASELTAAGLSAFAVQMDVRNKLDVQRGVEVIVAKWGAIYILVNNAGI